MNIAGVLPDFLDAPEWSGQHVVGANFEFANFEFGQNSKFARFSHGNPDFKICTVDILTRFEYVAGPLLPRQCVGVPLPGKFAKWINRLTEVCKF